MNAGADDETRRGGNAKLNDRPLDTSQDMGEIKIKQRTPLKEHCLRSDFKGLTVPRLQL